MRYNVEAALVDFCRRAGAFYFQNSTDSQQSQVDIAGVVADAVRRSITSALRGRNLTLIVTSRSAIPGTLRDCKLIC